MNGSAVTARDQLDAVFKALASSHRREILRLLGSADPGAAKTCCAPGEVCACRIAEHLGLAAPTISHHMAVLRDAGLVSARRDGTWTYYTLRRDALEAAAEALKRL